MSPRKPLSPNEVFINNIVMFCYIVLSKTDPLDFSHDLKKENEFFNNKNVYDSLISETNITYFKENISYMHYIVDFLCLKHITNTTNGYTPYSFYNFDEMGKYLKYLKKEFFNKHNVSLPDYFDNIIQWIILRAEEFRSDSAHENNQIKTTRKIVTEFIENDFKKEIERLTEEINNSFSNALKNINIVKENTNKQLEEAKNNLNEENQKKLALAINKVKIDIQNDLHKSEKNMMQTCIEILGVFAAVVLTFNMGISFGAEALEKFMQSGTYHSTLVILLFGFIIGNVIFALFAFLRYIHNKTPEKNIIPAENTPAGKTEEKLCKTIIGKIVIGFNGVLILLFIVNLIGWRYNSNKSETTTEPSSTCVCEQCISQTSETTTLDTFVEETT